MVNHPIISDESEIIAGLCYFNYNEVNRIYRLFNLTKKEGTEWVPYNSFIKFDSRLKNPMITKIFGTYKQANWDKFFQLVAMFSFLRADILLQLILIILNIRYENLITSEDLKTLFNAIASTKFVNTVEAKGSLKPMKYDELLSFIAKHPKSSRKLKSLQIILRQLLFDQRRCNEIYNRRNNILYRESYYKTNHQKLPKESCSNCLYRIFVTHDPYPYQYDYEIIPTIEKSKITVLTSYYKVTYNFNGYLLDNRTIKSVKETGEVKSDSIGISISSHTNGICGPTSYQVANNPCSSRSKVASRSRHNSYIDNNEVLDEELFNSQNNGNSSNHSTKECYALVQQNKKISINSKSILTNYSSNTTTQKNGSDNDKIVLSPSSIKPSLLLTCQSPLHNNNSSNTDNTTTRIRNRVVKMSNNYVSPKHHTRDSSIDDNKLSSSTLPNFIPEDEEGM